MGQVPDNSKILKVKHNLKHHMGSSLKLGSLLGDPLKKDIGTQEREPNLENSPGWRYFFLVEPGLGALPGALDVLGASCSVGRRRACEEEFRG